MVRDRIWASIIKLHTGFQFVPSWWPWVTLKGRHYMLLHIVWQLLEPTVSSSQQLDPYCWWQICTSDSLVLGSIWLIGRDAHVMRTISAVAGHLIYSCDLDFNSMTLIYEFDRDILKMYVHIKNEVCRSRLSKFKCMNRTDWLTNRHTHTQRRTERERQR